MQPLAVIAMNRELRRVPADFHWPLGHVWKGYMVPDELKMPDCPDCHLGFSREYSALADTFYPHMCANPDDAWHDKVTQEDVDWLLENYYLRTRMDDRTLQALPLTAKYVNEQQRTGNMITGEHVFDAGARHKLIEGRCNRMGVSIACATCKGRHNSGTPEQRAAYDAWQPYEPPVGDAIQLWETTSEGSPISPPFANTFDGHTEMFLWLEQNITMGYGANWRAHEWESALAEPARTLLTLDGKPF